VEIERGSAPLPRAFVLATFSSFGYRPAMPDQDEKLTSADPEEIADSISFALMFSGRKRVHDSDRMTASIAAQRIVRHLERCGYVLMKRPFVGGSAPRNPPASYPQTKPEDMK
jgi:hypothetical protein